MEESGRGGEKEEEGDEEAEEEKEENREKEEGVEGIGRKGRHKRWKGERMCVWSKSRVDERARPINQDVGNTRTHTHFQTHFSGDLT